MSCTWNFRCFAHDEEGRNVAKISFYWLLRAYEINGMFIFPYYGA